MEQPAGASGVKGGGPELRGWAVEERGRWERLLFGACEQVEGEHFMSQPETGLAVHPVQRQTGSNFTWSQARAPQGSEWALDTLALDVK